FIRGHVENDFSKDAFSLPLGKMGLPLAVEVLRQYCIKNDFKLRFSAVPEYAVEDFKALNPVGVEIIEDMGDYLYSAEKLSTLSGKKYNKKRNHINQFLAAYPDWSIEPITADNAQEALRFMDLIDREGDHIPMAVTERHLNRLVLEQILKGETQYIGAILRGGGEMLAFSIGDIKGDTLYVHIEKALREAPGAFEMINKSFARMVCEAHPEIEYINREDDAGDMGLRMAKESYHPVEILKKYNITF
ncbi:MAG: phosphatidylglycerol lysyltransferase domain-containing protein, partial [Muribaculaceae bacterium]|nr:phosphatidylglycerol lysyltransferase domain-containing protein [Muribaculaceae bacterium]